MVELDLNAGNIHGRWLRTTSVQPIGPSDTNTAVVQSVLDPMGVNSSYDPYTGTYRTPVDLVVKNTHRIEDYLRDPDLTESQPPRGRPDWDSYFFDLARVIATRATCPRASIGVVLVKNKRIIGTGYNGVAESRPHCPNTREHLALDHCTDAIHAEYNALTNALVPVHGATLYVVGPRPICEQCRGWLEKAGVTDVRHGGPT